MFFNFKFQKTYLYAGLVLIIIWLGIYCSIKGELLSAYHLDRNLRPLEPMLTGEESSNLSLKKFKEKIKSHDDTAGDIEKFKKELAKIMKYN